MKADFNASLYIQKQMNAAYKNKSYKKAYELFILMNEMRIEKGLDFLTMPALQARFETKAGN